MLLELDTMVDINASPLCSKLFVIKMPFLNKKKKLYLFLWWLEFSLKNLEFSIKFFISLLLNTFMIHGFFFSLGGEIYFKFELMVDFFFFFNLDVKYDLFIYEVAVWDMGFYPTGPKEHWERFEKDPSWICDYKFFNNMQRFWSLKWDTKIVNFENEI